jgi:hypothetical protein
LPWAYTRNEWLETVPTFGSHSQLPPENLAELLADMEMLSMPRAAESLSTTPLWWLRRHGSMPGDICAE